MRGAGSHKSHDLHRSDIQYPRDNNNHSIKYLKLVSEVLETKCYDFENDLYCMKILMHHKGPHTHTHTHTLTQLTSSMKIDRMMIETIWRISAGFTPRDPLAKQQ